MSRLILPGILLMCGMLLSVTSADDETTALIVAGVSCASTESLVRGMQMCLNTYTIPLTIPTDQLEDVTSFLTTLYQQLNSTTIKTLCRTENRENYVSATLCIFDVSKKCSPEISSSLVNLTPETLRQQIEFQCQSLTDYNQACTMEKLPEILECTNNSAFLDSGPDSDDTLDDIVCRSRAVARICATQLLAECGAATLQIYLQQLPPLPEGCYNDTGRQPSSNNGTVDCSKMQAVGRAYLKCQVESGVFLLLPKTIQTHDDVVELTLKKINDNLGPKVCSKLAQYETLVNCTLSVQSLCSADEKHALPDIGAVQEGLRNVCQHVDDYNSTCITTSLAALNSTEVEAAVSQQTPGCEGRKANVDALLGAVGSCDEKTVSLYRDSLTAQLPTECRPTKTTTSDDNAGIRTTIPVFSLIVMIICVIIL